ncbi:MAG TPA: hypothetical protein VFL79_02295 [Terriglobia bacterium]|nr:hypothetical protein [Terriglobia bacterium]
MGNRNMTILGIATRASCLAMLALAVTAASHAAQQAVPQTSATGLPSRIGPKAQDLLNHAIQALGGPAFLNFKNISASGRVFGFSNDQMAGVFPYKSIDQPPDKRRFTYGKGKPVTLINNGDDAWELDQYGLVHQLPEKVRQWKIANRYGLMNLFRSIIKEGGVLILDHGVDFVANQPSYVIDIIDAQNVHIRLYLRKSNYLPLRVIYRIQNSTTQDWDEYTDEYNDYQSFDSIMTPMNIDRRLNGDRIGAVYRNKVQYNVEVPANYFEPPR